VIALEKEPGEDGKKGSMALCTACQVVFVKQLGEGYAEFVDILRTSHLVAAPMFTVFRDRKGQCDVNPDAKDDWWAPFSMHGATVASENVLAMAKEKGIVPKREGIHFVEIEHVDDSDAPGSHVFDDNDATLCFLNEGGAVVKLPDTMTSEHWRYYILEDEKEGNELGTGPVFKHDCDDCEYLGHFDEHDLYYCKNGGPTVIARWGGDGPDYASGMSIAAARDFKHTRPEAPGYSRALRTAYLIAVDMGKETGR
jgi:hypothetical protein